MKIPRSHMRRPLAPALALTAAIVLVGTACSSGGSGTGTSTGQGASQGTGPSTITVAVAYPAPPAAMLDQFTKQTGIKVNWVNIGWDDLQTKIAAAMTSNAYFADATDVDWSKVGEYYKTGWFLPLNKWFSVSSLRPDMPQLGTFIVNNELIGVPFDSSFMVTTINTKDFEKAGISTAPTTLGNFSADLKKVATATGMSNPLDIQLATAEGLSTCWYQMTAAFGGQVLNAQDAPQFTAPGSPGYQAMAWMVNAYKDGLVAKGNIQETDYNGLTAEMAKNKVAAELCDYAGSVGSIYDVPSSSSVVNQVQYVPTPGAHGVAPNVANPDGIGIPKTAKDPAAAAEFIKWFTTAGNQAMWSGLDGPSDVISGFPLPMRLSGLDLLAKSGKVPQAAEMETLLRDHAQAPFPEGAPPWYAQFSNAVYTNIHQAAAGQETVQQAVTNIASQASQLKASG
jgi:multiple sugar transport system substrate-binding protein